MNMKRTLLFFVATLFLLITTLSCEIGLGEAVDTQAPRVDIVSPTMDSLHKGEITINGIWEDDSKVDEVWVTLKRTDRQDIEPISKRASISESVPGSGTWKLDIKTEKDKVTNFTEFLDGPYSIEITAKDLGGHISKATTKITIDNTPPVIAFERPSSKVGDEKYDSYGQALTFVGEAADDNGIAKLVIDFYSDKELTNKIKTIEKENIDYAINIDVANYKENKENEYWELYFKNNNDTQNDRKLYYKLEVFDKAGNSTTDYYLKSNPEVSQILREYKITGIYKMLNGNYVETKNDSRSIQSILAKFQGQKVEFGGQFTLNPKNNPTYSIGGSEPIESIEDFNSGSNQITDNSASKIVIDLSVGLDKIPIAEKDINIGLYPISENTTIEDIENLKDEDFKILDKKYYEVNPNGLNYSITIHTKPLEKDKIIEPKMRYIIRVIGHDSDDKNKDGSTEDGNKILSESGKPLGFKYIKVPMPIILSLDDIEDPFITRGNNLTVKGAVNYRGFISDFDFAIYINKNATDTIKADSNKIKWNHHGDEHKFSYTFENLDLGISGQKKINYIITPSDKEQLPVASINFITYDITPPEVEVTVPGINQAVDTAKMDMSGTIRDSGVGGVSILLSVSNLKGPVQTKTLTSSKDGGISGLNWNTKVDLDANGEVIEGPYKLDVKAQDKLGNTTVLDSINFYFDESNPTLTETSGNDGITTNTKTTISGNASDTNGLKNIIIKDLCNGTEKQYSLIENTEEYKTSQDWSYTVPQVDGKHAITIIAEDIAGKTTTHNCSVIYDQKAPTGNSILVTESQKANDKIWITTTNQVIVKVTEPSENINVKGIVNKSKEFGFSKGNDGYVGEYTATEGENVIEFVLTDMAGNTTKDDKNTITVYVDTKKPNLTIDSDKNVINNKDATFTIKGTAFDANGLNTVSLNYKDKSETINVSSSDNIWTKTFSVGADATNPKLSDGIYTFTITATDKAGKETTVSKEVVIDTNIPVMSSELTVPKVDQTEASMFKFGGSVTDSGVSCAGYKVEFAFGNATKEEAPSGTIFETTVSSDGTWNYAVDFTSTTVDTWFNEEGVKHFYARVTDNVGNVSKWVCKEFTYDKSSPEVTEETLGLTNILNKDFTLSGKVTDGNAISSFTVKLRDDLIYTPTISDTEGSWSLPFVVGSKNEGNEQYLADGKYQITFTAIDIAGKTAEFTKDITVDTVAPTIGTITIGEKPTSWYSKNLLPVKVTGITEETSGIFSVEIIIDEGKDKPSTITLRPTTASEYVGDLNLEDGSHTIKCVLTDNAKNTTTTEVQTINIDTVAPILKETNEIKQSNGNLVLTGIVSDANLPSDFISITDGSTTYKTSNITTTVNPTKATEYTWTLEFKDKSLTEGKHTFNIKAHDLSGQQTTISREVLVDKTAPKGELSIQNLIGGSWVNNNQVKVKVSNLSIEMGDTQLDGVGIESVTAYVEGGESVPLSKKIKDSIPYYEGSLNVSDGTKTIKVILTDKVGNSSDPSKDAKTQTTVNVDTTKPELTVDETSILKFMPSSGFVIKGTAKDTNTMVLTVTENFTGKTKATPTNTKTVTVNSDNTWKLGVPFSGTAVEGEYTYSFELKDAATNTSTYKSEVIKVDTSAPKITITDPTNATVQNAISVPSYIFKGKVNEVTGVNSPLAAVWYQIVDGNNAKTPAVPDTGAASAVAKNWTDLRWTSASKGVEDWTFFNTFKKAGTEGEGKPEGKYTLFVYAVDEAGNRSIETIESKKNFDVDMNNPTLTETTNDAKTIFNNDDIKNGVKFGGDVSDSNGIVSLTYKINDGTAFDILTAEQLTKATTWEKNFSIGTSSGDGKTSLLDGKYKITITAKDSVGKITEIVKNITVDTVAPTGTLTVDGVNGGWSSTNLLTVNVTGVPTDTSGIYSVVVKINETEEVVLKPVTGDATKYTGKINVSDGDVTLKYILTDNAENSTTTEGVSFKVDTVAPELTETNEIRQVKDELELKGTVFDSNGIKEICVRDRLETETNDNAPKYYWTKADGDTDAITYTPSTRDWNYNLKTSDREGKHLVTISATDVAGKTYSLPERTVYVDTTAPSGKATLEEKLSGASYYNKNQLKVTVTGATDDIGGKTGTGVASVTAQLEGTETPVTLQKTSDGSFVNTIYGLNDGANTINVVITDKVGNASSPISLKANVDLSKPNLTLDETIMDTVGSASNELVLFGVASDTFGLSSLKLSYGKTPTVVELPLPSTKEGKDKDKWSHTFKLGQTNSSDPNYLPDGKYTFTITATDNANRTETITKTIVIDTVNPTLKDGDITVPKDGTKETEASLFKFFGTVYDGDAATSSGYKELQFAFTEEGKSNPFKTTISSNGEWSYSVEFQSKDFNTYFTEQGPKSIFVQAVDNVGNVSGWVSKLFTYDTESPKATEETLAADDLFENKGFSIGGAVEDTYGVKSISVQVKNDKGNVGDPYAATLTEKEAKNTTWSYDFIVGKETVEGKTKLTDGLYTFDITVTDKANKTTTIKRTVKVDTTAPTFNQDSFVINNGKADYSSLSKNWYKSSQVTAKVSGIKDNLSGIQSVTAICGGKEFPLTRKASESGETYFEGFVSTEKQGQNNITYKLVDNAGNTVTTGVKSTVYIDTNNPSEVSSETTGTTLVNGKNDLSFTITAKDAEAKGASGTSSGIKSIEIVKLFGTELSPTIKVENNNGTPDKYTLTIPQSHFIGSATGAVEVTVTDKVGNKHTFTPFSIDLDKTAPETKINMVPDAYVTSDEETKNNIDVNGTIKISGSSSDANGISSVQLQYLKDGTWTDYGATITSNPYNWSVEVDTTDENKFTNGKPVEFRAIATDKALNTNEETATPITLFINQDSDRPIITFTTVELKGNNDSTPANLKNSSTLYGMISDDDGVKELYCSSDGSNWGKPIPVTNGSWNTNLPDGTQKLYFKVVASDGTEKGTKDWISSTESSTDAPKVKGSDGEFIDSGVINLRVDTHNPEKTNVRFATFGSFSEGSVDVYSDYENTIVKEYQPFTDKLETLGGIHSKFKINIDAYDANGIKSVTAKLGETDPVTLKAINTVYAYEYNDISGIGHTVYAKAKDETSKTNFFKDPALQTKVSESDIPQDITPKYVYDYGTYEVEFDVSNMKTGSHTLVYTVLDNADLKNESSVQVGIDNTAPKLNVKGPSSNKTSSGSISVYGDVDSSAKLYYSVKSHSDKTETNGSYTPKYNRIKDATLSWYVYFDGDKEGSKTSAHTDLMNTYLTKIYTDVTEDNIGNNTYTAFTPVNFCIKAVDDVGNVSTEVLHKIVIDPQGDRPTVAITTPTSGSTVGGAVKFYGTAIDEIGTKVGVESVWVQIKSDKVSDFYDENTQKVKNTILTYQEINDMRKVGTVYDISKNPEVELTTDLKEGAKNLNNYALKVTNFKGASWNFEINAPNNEGVGLFDPTTGKKNAVGVRVIAKDKDKKLSLPSECLLEFDADNPVIKDLYLSKEGKTIAYTEDMFISGSGWTLHGTATDKDTVTTIKVDSIPIEKKVVTETEVTFTYNLGLDGTGVGSKEIKLEATDNGDHTQTLNLKINYDNQAPTIISDNTSTHTVDEKLYYNIDKTVKQSNSFYRFGSRVSEAAVNGSNQSGLAYVAAYFVRNEGKDGKTKSIYNPLLGKDNAARITNVTNATAVNGLYWIESKATQDGTSDNVFVLSAANPNIHVNSLVMINGSYYLITDITPDGLTITLNGNPKRGETTETTVKIANAFIIDNPIQESGSGTIDANGYYEKVLNDDGDKMEEVAEKKGSNWDWEAAICSRNIPDGPIEIHYVAIDKAGNFAEGKVMDAKVENNPPRLSGLKIWSDFNLDGSFDTKKDPSNAKEVFSYTFMKNEQKAVTRDLIVATQDKKAIRTIKDKFVLFPEIVGGNGNLHYSYKIGPNLSKPLVEVTDANCISLTTDGKVLDTTSSNKIVGDDNHDEFTVDGNTNSRIVVDPSTINTGTTSLPNSSNEVPTWFEYTIWDSTGDLVNSNTKKNANSLSSKFTVALNLQHNDTKAPNAVIDPFKWESAGDGIKDEVTGLTTLKNNVCWKGETPLGHIELESDWKTVLDKFTQEQKTTLGKLADTDPKVSGKIKITGTAWDDIYLKDITIKFPGVVGDNEIKGTTKTVASYNTDNGKWAITSGKLDPDKWEFALKDISEDDGKGNRTHKIRWTFTVDTTIVPNEAALDQIFSINVTDVKSKTTGPNENEKDEIGKPINKLSYQMDVVPYIIGINTSLSPLDVNNPSIYSRSAMGHYSVTSNEVITFVGFNLDTAKYNNNGTKASSENCVFAYRNYPSFVQVNVKDSTLKSGPLELKVGNIPTLNNYNNNDAKGSAKEKLTDTNYKSYAYNRQPNGSNNNRLTDDIILDVWEFNKIKQAGSGIITEPIMHINPTNDLVCFAFNEDPVNFYMSNGQDNSFTQWQRSNAPYVSSDFIIDNFGKTHGITVNTDMMRAESDTEASQNKQAGGARMTYMYGNWGTSHVTGNSGAGVQGTFTGINCTRLESIGIPATKNELAKILTDRFPNPSLASSTHEGDTTDTHVYLAYYDKIKREIRFRWGNVINAESKKHDFTKPNKVGSFNAGYSFDQFADSRDSVQNNEQFGAFEGQHARDLFNPLDKYYSVVASESVNVPGGEYVSIAVVPGNTAENDTVVMTWFDEINNAWMYSYKTNPCNDNDMGIGAQDGKGNWKTPINLKNMAGEYCKIAVDSKNGVHIVSYDKFNADLLYVYLPTYSSAYDSTKSLCVVDAAGIVGTNITLDTVLSSDGNYVVPYIGYYAGSIDKAKIAYLPNVIPADTTKTSLDLSSSQGAINQQFTQVWEVSNIPILGGIRDDNINVAVWKDRSTGAITKPSVQTKVASGIYGNNTAYPILGYAKNDGVLETAQMR